jgi:hypothetical protein
MKCARRGFALFEMLVLLILFAAFALVASKLYASVWRLMYNATQAQTSETRLNSALATLRRDVWNAERIAGGDAKLTLSIAGTQPVVWSIASDGTWTRRSAGEQHWAVGLRNVAFGVRDPEIVVHIPDSRQSRGDDIRLVSQLRLAERSGP